MDLHAPQIPGFYSPNIILENLSSSPSVVKFLKEKSGIPDLEDMVIVAADKGDVDRAEDLNNRLNLRNPPANIHKQRDKKRRITKMELVGNVRGKRVFIPDDIIDKGATLCKGGELLLNEGALEINCYATHGWFTKGVEIVTNYFNRTMVSNTHNKDYGEKVQVIDMSPIFAEAIYRAHRGESVSELFE
jgi:ribose-phosphate pyrophosphokinase